MKKTIMIHLNPPSYDVDIYKAENSNDIQVLREQGYHTFNEVIELAREALAARDETCPVCKNPHMHLTTDEKYFCASCGYEQP